MDGQVLKNYPLTLLEERYEDFQINEFRKCFNVLNEDINQCDIIDVNMM